MLKRRTEIRNLMRGIPWSTELDLRYYPVEVVRRRRSNVEIVRALKSDDPASRINYLRIMQNQLHRGQPAIYFEYARGLLTDRNNTCRWQAAILLGLFIPYRPAELWQIITEMSRSRSSDMRVCMSVVLLEHFLPEHPQYRTKAQQLAATSRNFARMLYGCMPHEEFTNLLPEELQMQREKFQALTQKTP